MARSGLVSGWKLPVAERARLLDLFPPRYAITVADHVTLAAGVSREDRMPAQVEAFVVGHADDGISLECLVVALDGTTARPDGSTYHITWSLGHGRRPVESNDVLRETGWRSIEPIPLTLQPAIF
jgi:hypothetical protein